uniref:Uncharacterized protein n=1 Tax=Avena sativa TaxID=4498 RepID=A0ACD5XTV0_AVESA
MVPINQKLTEGNDGPKHWYAISVNTKCKRFEVLDSLRGGGDEGLHAHASLLINHIKGSWNHHYGESKIKISEFETIYPDVPRQTNGDDCGFHVLVYFVRWLGRGMSALYADDIIDARKVWAYKLINSTPFNKNTDAKTSIEDNIKVMQAKYRGFLES